MGSNGRDQAAAVSQQSVCAEEESEEMLAEERDLAEDAQWKRIQQNTFTRWVNEHLRQANKCIATLETDLSDGLNLIALVEVLSHKRMHKHNKRPTFRSQQLENVSVALKFLERDENIKIVNIDSSHIVDCQLKLILGLVWTLILHYSISMPMWDGEEDAGEKGPTPKQRLMNWIKAKLPELPVKNFTTDWGDGKAIGALVDGVAPGLCPDWSDWKPEDALKNASEAMGLADDWLSVPQLIQPEDMIDPNVDDLSMMTYLSQYPNAKLKPNAPLRPKTNPDRVRCYGPGVEPTGPVVGAPTFFTVETFSAGQGKVECSLVQPNGESIPIEAVFNGDRNLTHTCTYTPTSEGTHQVIVKFIGRQITKSPFHVSVEGYAGDPSKVTASGPGLQPTGVVVSKPTYFDIFTKEAGKGTPEVVLLDPQGRKDTSAKLKEVKSGHWRCEYLATHTGLYSVNIFFATRQITNSPFGVKVGPACDPRRVRASGRGLQARGVRSGEKADFKLVTEGAGDGEPRVRVIAPGGADMTADIRKVGDFTYTGEYWPVKDGRYIVMISYGGHEIPKSPFEVNVGPKKNSGIRCFGPGLRGGVVGLPASFTVDTNGETGALGFAVEGPSEARIQCADNGDGSAVVTYTPTADGEYAVHVLCDGEDVPQSPWMAQIQPADANFHPDKVKVYGPGVESEGVQTAKPTHFTVDATKAGKALLDISLIDSDYATTSVNAVESSAALYKAEYTAHTAGKHLLQVIYGGVAVPGSPFSVKVRDPVDARKVRLFGPALESGVRAHQPTHFNVDAKNAGQGELQCVLLERKTGEQLPVRVTDSGDGLLTCDCVYPTPGPYTLKVTYGGTPVPQSPVDVDVKPNIDLTKIRVRGLEPDVLLNSPVDVTVDTSALPAPADGKVVGIVTEPDGDKLAAVVQLAAATDGVHQLSYTPAKEGRHVLDITYDGVPVPGSPFQMQARPGADASRVRAYGPGVERAIIDKPNKFTVNTRGAGSGGLGLTVEGPSETKMTCEDNRDGTCDVEYVPTAPGEYDVCVKFADQHIPGSPFKVPVDAVVAADRVKAFGPGLEKQHCRAAVPQTFTVDTTQSATAPLDVQISSDKGPLSQKATVEDNGDGTFSVSYNPPPVGSVCIPRVKFGGVDIPGSPWRLPVRPTCEPDKVRLSGPGVSSKAVPASLPTSFTIDTKDAGFADLEAQILGPDGYPRKVSVVDNGDGTYTGHYTPDDCGRYKVKVLYGGKEVAGSPVPVQAVAVGQADRCRIEEGDFRDQVLSVDEEYCITVDAKQAGNGKVTCRIRSASAAPLNGHTNGQPNGHRNVPANGSRNGPVNGQRSGSDGDTASDVDIDIEECGDGTFKVFYKVKNPGDYTLNIKFGGQSVPEGFYSFAAQGDSDDMIQAKEDRLAYARAPPVKPGDAEYRPIQLANIPLPTTGGHVTAEVKMPSGKLDRPVIEDNRDGTVCVKYEPKEEGLHELLVKYNQEHVQGSPFKFHVDAMASGFVTAYGPGLVHGITGQTSNFTISTKDAGAGGLSLAVEGPSKAEINCQDNKDGTVSVSYLPTAPGEYKVAVKFADIHIKGSPYSVKVTGEGRKRNQVSVGNQSDIALPGKVTETDIQALTASIRAPSGLQEPCFLKRLPNDHLGISFTPREVGQHLVTVKKRGVEISGSPFKIVVSAKEVGDAGKVLVHGDALYNGKTHQDNEIVIDTREAGYGGLSMSVEGPSKAEIKCDDKDDGKLYVSYNPKEPGQYILNLKFADHHVKGSPFTPKVSGEGSDRQMEKIKCDRAAAPVTAVGSKCALTFKMPGVATHELSATVAAPDGTSAGDAEISQLQGDLHAVSFVPRELGVHTVAVRYRDVHIPGSPFQFTVGPLKDAGAHRVHAGGPGLERGKQNVPNEFDIWTREAGAGSLSISAEGPSKADINFKDRKDGSCYVSYLVSEPGEYRIGIKFNDVHIPESPYKVYVAPHNNDASKVVVSQLPESVTQTDKPVMFAVDCGDCDGQLDCKVVSPSGHVDDCFVSQLDDQRHSVRFVPRETGPHHVHATWNGVHVAGSPFRVHVGALGDSDAATVAVHAHGSGLERAVTGQRAEFIVDTCNAAAGTLAVTVDGPSKVAMDCIEVDEGYKVRYTPLSPGVYFVGVKYDGQHITDSPYRVRVTGTDLSESVVIKEAEQASMVVETMGKTVSNGRRTSTKRLQSAALPAFNSDASRVVCQGSGLRRASLGKQNHFTVDASSAGEDILWVGCFGQRRPCDEVHIKHVGNNVYRVFYTVIEPGSYLLAVRWGEQHIPGSPFQLHA